MRSDQRSDLGAATRVLVALIAVAIVLWIGYVVVFAVLGGIARTSNSGISIETGDLSAEPGTAASSMVSFVQGNVELFGWTPDVESFTITIGRSSADGAVECFDVHTADTTFVARAAHRGGQWTVTGVAQNMAPNRWETVFGSALGTCAEG